MSPRYVQIRVHINPIILFIYQLEECQVRRERSGDVYGSVRTMQFLPPEYNNKQDKKKKKAHQMASQVYVWEIVPREYKPLTPTLSIPL